MTYAIFRTGDKQYRAEAGKTIRVPLLELDPGAEITFDDVLLTSDGEKVVVGAPRVDGASVVGTIVEHGRDKKIVVFKHKRRKKYRKKAGHRQGYTAVHITDVKAENGDGA